MPARRRADRDQPAHPGDRGRRGRRCALRATGCRVGLDDFGTGYSALSHLQAFELDFLKIDRSFISELGRGDRHDAVVKAVVDLAHAHRLVVVAEGVEDEHQRRLLRAMGCDQAQGWLFGRPAAP